MILECRDVISSDAKILFQWANDPMTRKNSFNSTPINWNDHIEWLENSINNAYRKIYLIFQEENPTGVVQFKKNEFSVIGVTVSPEFRGRGLGAQIIQVACKKYFSETEEKKIIAYIKKENTASVRAFQKAGFILFKEELYNNYPCKIFILENNDDK